jgi:Domain of unknown function (DUF4232)
MIANISHDDAGTPEADADDLRRAFPPGAEPPFRTPVTALVANARRRGRRRRIARLSAKTALVAVPAIAAVVMFTNFSPATNTTAVVPPAAPSRAPASVAPSQPVAACTGAQLSGKVSRAGSVASQPFDEIVLTNRGPSSCKLSGYPKLTAWGSTGHGPSSLLNTALTRGSTFEIPDPGPTDIVIARGKSAWFAIGSGTSSGGPIVTIDHVIMDVVPAAGGKAGHVNIALGMDASGPQGKAIPITVTAFAPGVPPKP